MSDIKNILNVTISQCLNNGCNWNYALTKLASITTQDASDTAAITGYLEESVVIATQNANDTAAIVVFESSSSEINGYLSDVQVSVPYTTDDELPRAVIISLFTWRRSEPDDLLPGNNKFGWWGDTYPDIVNDQIGSRLWLLSRSILIPETAGQAYDYAMEALQWLIDDGVASSIDIQTALPGVNQLSLSITITHGDATTLNLRFADVWSFLNV